MNKQTNKQKTLKNPPLPKLISFEDVIPSLEITTYKHTYMMQMIHRYMCACMNLSMYVLPWTEMRPSWVLSRCGQRTGHALVCNRCQHAKKHGRFGRDVRDIPLEKRFLCLWKVKVSKEKLRDTARDELCPAHPTPERWERSKIPPHPASSYDVKGERKAYGHLMPLSNIFYGVTWCPL